MSHAPWNAPQFQPPRPYYPAPAPAGPPAPYVTPRPVALQRPAVVTLAATMTVTASLQWICGLTLAWLVATAGAASLDTSNQVDGGVYHALHRFHLRMIEGLAWPLYLLPLASFGLGFVVLAPRPWARWALTVVGLVALGWSAWWLHNHLIWWLAPALYIVVACLVLWTPGATHWYRQRGQTWG